jgi:hypothetical protein
MTKGGRVELLAGFLMVVSITSFFNAFALPLSAPQCQKKMPLTQICIKGFNGRLWFNKRPDAWQVTGLPEAFPCFPR